MNSTKINKPSLVLSLYLFLMSLGVYLLTMPGYLSMDEETMFLVTQSFVEDGDVSIEGGFLEDYTDRIGQDGNRYAMQEIGHPLYGSLFYIMGKVTSSWIPKSYRPFYLRMAVQSSGPIAGAATVALLFLYLTYLGFDRLVSVGSSLALGFSSTFWVYSGLFFRASLLGFLLLALLFSITVYVRTGNEKSFFVGAGAAFFLSIIKALYLPLTAAVLVVAIVYRELYSAESKNIRNMIYLSFVTSGVLFAATGIDLMYNIVRFGDPFSSGYDLSERFSPWIVPGLIGTLFSPGKSLFVYSPVLLVGVPGLFPAWETDRPVYALLLGMILYPLFVYSGWYLWEGGFATWGSRFMVPVLPLLFVCVARGFTRLRKKFGEGRKKWLFLGVGILLCMGGGLQVMGNLTGGDLVGDERTKLISLYEERWTISGSRALGPRRWRSLFKLRWGTLKDPPDFTKSVQSSSVKQVREETPRLWWVLMYRLGMPVVYLTPAFLSLVLVLFGMGGLVFWSSSEKDDIEKDDML